MNPLKYILVSVLSVMSVFCMAQETTEPGTLQYTHKVFHVDGTVLKCVVLEWTQEAVKLRLSDGQEIMIDAEEVVKIVALDKPLQKVVQEKQRIVRPYEFKEAGMYHVTSIAFSAGPYAGAGINHAVGYRFSRLLGIGGGLGVESYDLGSGTQIIPIFAEARGFFSANAISPYYAVRTGYGVALKNAEGNIVGAKGGMLYSGELGYRFGGSRHVNFFAGMGVHFQKATYEYERPWEVSITDVIQHRRTEFKCGIIF